MTNAEILARADWVLEDGVLVGRGKWADYEITRWFRKGPFFLHSSNFVDEHDHLGDAFGAAGYHHVYTEYALRGDGPSLAIARSTHSQVEAVVKYRVA